MSFPADPCCRCSPEMCSKDQEEETEMQNIPHREAVGSLMHITVMTRPDISYALGQVAQYVERPGKQHWRAVKRILAYLKKTSNFSLRFNKNGSSLTGFCDSDYGLSTTEAEFVAAVEATKEAVWIQQLLYELDMVERPTLLHCNNQSAIALVKNPAFHQRI